MIDVSYLIANLDAVLGDNMFLKDAHKANALKDSIQTVFNQMDTKIHQMDEQLAHTTTQTYSDIAELDRIETVLRNYFRSQIDINKQLLNDLGEWY